jgi:hypothetical protein
MTIGDRAAAITRANLAMAHLEQHRGTTPAQLRAARALVNIVRSYRDAGDVWSAVEALETIVLHVDA